MEFAAYFFDELIAPGATAARLAFLAKGTSAV
jgi:hypothetical protein